MMRPTRPQPTGEPAPPPPDLVLALGLSGAALNAALWAADIGTPLPPVGLAAGLAAVGMWWHRAASRPVPDDSEPAADDPDPGEGS